MALFTGSFKEFEKYVGPTTNKLITKLGKELKREQKSCQNHQIGGENCGVWKRLDAAHFSSQGRDRKSMIKELLESNFKIEEDIYNVDLDKFIILFEEQHRNKGLSSNLIMLCRQHHARYDLPYKGKNVGFEYEDVEILENYSLLPLLLTDAISEHKSTEIKKSIVKEINELGVTLSNCSYAKFTNKKWQFDIKEDKLKQDLYFVFYNPSDYSFDIGKITEAELDKISMSLKQKEYDDRKAERSFSFDFDGDNYIEKHTQQIVKVIYSNRFEIQTE
ncbi:hypothetical protein [Myroides marinus]|uniref:hypothetical protein n=1 Tax=Myroides marinus TaxID=703342 RepID=UPI002574A15F|nr:hypothetical protein [Myroides marinus]MDM1346497.1 hypothetical protein [Myroides marinus]MDM1349916.1 hypothetical protein [Myroides marinus]MDM1357124.1 hypothetical protein [Myroides marinus]